MAGFNIGGSGNEYDKLFASGALPPQQDNSGGVGRKRLRLTKKQKAQLAEALQNGRVRPTGPQTKYGVNLPPTTTTHTKYGINCSLPDQPTVNTKYGINCPPPSSQTKYGINFPQTTTHTKYGVNCPPTK